jgi:hypothetical protein
LVAAIGDRDGSATALRGIVRAGREYHFDRKDVWSDKEKGILKDINGRRTNDGPLRFVSCKIPRAGKLWIGPRKGLNDGLEERYRDCYLRLATWQTNSRMKLLTTNLD